MRPTPARACAGNRLLQQTPRVETPCGLPEPTGTRGGTNRNDVCKPVSKHVRDATPDVHVRRVCQREEKNIYIQDAVLKTHQ